MKHILTWVLLAFAASVGAADFPQPIVAKVANKSGGEIVFTVRETEHCGKQHGEVYSTTVEGGLITGCWRMVDDMYVVWWDDKTRSAYKVRALVFADWFIEAVNKPQGTKL